MALRVWLPLNGDLENKGISDITVTNNGATIDNNGKIGKCYNFGATNSAWINTDYTYDSINTNWSLACWVKPTGRGCVIRSNTKYSPIIDFQGTNNGLRVFYWYSTSSYYMISLNKTETPNDVWAHICVTSNGTIMSLYLNGILKSTTNISGNPTPYITGHLQIGYSEAMGVSEALFHGNLNDVRIYDHCLSAKEVKEISQGLVLHYKLDGFSGGAGENLLWNSKKLDIASAISNKNCSNRGSSVRQLRTDGFNEVRCSAAWQGLSAWVNQFNLKSGDKLTYSFYVYTNGSNKSLSFYPMMYDSSGARDTSSKLDISLDGGAYTSTNSKSWGAINNTAPIRHYVTFIWNDTMASILNNGGKIELSIQIHGTFNSGEYGYIFAPKLEYGDKPTAWSPAPEEIGIDITRITDSSGYGNDGIINGNLITNNNTSKYSSSTFFDGNTAAIKIPFNDIIKDKNYTVSCWTYKTTIGTKNYQTILGGPSGFELEARSSSNTSPLYRIHNWGGGTTPYEFNKWNHFCFVHTDADSKLYVNGELKITGTSANIPTGNYFIGSWSTATSQNYEGQMSDFRLYTTALSAEDILDLYHTPANIDNLGGIHGFEMAEDISSRELLALPWTSSYGTHNKTSISTNYNDKKEWYSNTNSSAGSDYIKINPTGKTYYYDTEISVAAGNQFYIGFERYDENKTSRSNNACAYIVSIKPTSDIIHQRYFGTVNLATDGVNPTDTIALRILNAWSGTTSGSTKEGTIHYLSLREVSGKPQTEKIKQQGQVCTDEFVEREKQASIYENGFVGGNIIIEK